METGIRKQPEKKKKEAKTSKRHSCVYRETGDFRYKKCFFCSNIKIV